MAPHGTEQGMWVEIEQVLRESESRAVAGQFSAAIMHEINNPLETISNLAYLIELEADNPVKMREYIASLQGEVANVIRIARQTLSFYKPSDVRLPVDLVEVAESAVRVHERRIAAKKVRLVKDLADEVRIEVHPGEMLQVFSNLLGNALDALPDNGTLHLRFRRRGDQVHTTIADNGSGIPLEPVMNFVFASPLESVNDVDSLALKETARPQTVPQTRFGGRIYSETGHFSRKFSSRTRSKFITGSSVLSQI